MNKQDILASEYLREVRVSKQGMSTTSIIELIEGGNIQARELKTVVRRAKSRYSAIRFYDTKTGVSVGYDRNCYDIVNAEIFGNHGTYIGLSDSDKVALTAFNQAMYQANKLEKQASKQTEEFKHDIQVQKDSKKIHRIKRQNKKRADKALIKRLELFASGYNLTPAMAIERMELSIGEKLLLQAIYCK